MDVVDSCRICLANRARIPIFESSKNEYKDLEHKLILCLGEKIEDIPKFPRHICTTCYSKINDIVLFLNNYKETCAVLEGRLKTDIKIESLKEEDNDDQYYVPLSEQEPEVECNIMKTESKIVFSDGNQLEQIIKPFLKGSKKETKNQTKTLKNETSLSVTKKEVKRNISKGRSKKNLDKKKIGTLSLSNKCISSCILEESFVFSGEKWCLNGHKKANDKEKNDKSNTIDTDSAKNTSSKSDTVNKPQKKEIREKFPPEPHLCELCGKTFTKHEELRNHISKVHYGLTSTCSTCSKTYANPRGLQKHMKAMHSERNLICSGCGKAFGLQHCLNEHFKRVHSKDYVKKKYECKICGKVLSTKQIMLIHERSVHTGERPEICSICGSTFSHVSYLKAHMRLHTGETPYKCPVCGRGYAQLCNMKSHIKHGHRLSQLNEVQLKTVPQRFFKFMQP